MKMDQVLCAGCGGACARDVIRRVPTSLALYAILVLTQCATSSWQQSLDTMDKTDPRITYYEDFRDDPSIHVYENKAIQDYGRLLVDVPRHQVIVGARDHLLRLSMADLSEVELLEWSPQELTTQICEAKGSSKADCHNFIRVLLLHEGKVFSCGTNAFSPICTWRSAQNLHELSGELSGTAKCPFNPHYNNTALMTSDGNLYSATVTDFTERDHVIYRVMGPSKPLRTVQYNSRWLNEPDFVSSYEIEDYVYFFFTEAAVEYMNCGKNVYSRVARICKNDPGGHFLLEENWTTFQKARLNCSLPGNYPFYFNHLQSTFYLQSQGLVFAVFSTPPTSIYGSAVCVYKLAEFQAAFGGPYKHQENSQMAWTKVNNNNPLQCGASSNGKRAASPNQTPAQRSLVHAQKFQIMDLAVQPIVPNPMVISEHHRYTHLVVDEVVTKHHEKFFVLFLGTLEGVIRKVIMLPHSNQTCVIEEIHTHPANSHSPITAFELTPQQGILVVGTHDRVLSIPVQRCHRFTSRLMCLGAQDPYCGWDSLSDACTRVPLRLPAHHWHQNITSCPHTHTLHHPINGRWSKWSSWEPCKQKDPAGGEKCRCRLRVCDNPAPQYGGETCEGSGTEVTNCTVNGGWTDWSRWSGCSASCGIAVRQRQRNCGNPQPRFGGRVCVGTEKDEDYCHDNPNCVPTPPPVVPGVWGPWSKWSPCTTQCGGGAQSRFRMCSTLPAEKGGVGCYGNSEEHQSCNQEPCKELRKVSDWTPWLRLNSSGSDGSYTEARYRFICKAHVPGPHMFTVARLKQESRYCSNNGKECQDAPFQLSRIPDPTWSSWSPWTQCGEMCGGGLQTRNRYCGYPGGGSTSHKECDGHNEEVQHCNTHSCQGEWSCWSDYTACSSSCGHGRKWRKRVCQSTTSGTHYTVPCYGTDKEEIPCQAQPCEKYTGWRAWSDWTLCNPEGMQHRTRQCGLPFPQPQQCQGPLKETRVCNYNEIQISLGAMQDQAALAEHCDECFQVYHLIIVGIIGFVLGGVVCVGIFLYCQRQHQEHRHNNKYHLQHSPDHIKSNDYISPSELDLLNHVPAHNGTYSSMGSLKRGKDSNNFGTLTVKEAERKRESMLRGSNSTLMRTNLQLTSEQF